MNEKVNYDGVKFGMLTVLKDGSGLMEGKEKRRSVICKCDCGNEKEVLLRTIKKGRLKSCGCLALPKIEVSIGDVYNHWTVLGEAPNYKSPKGETSRAVFVKCVCGKEKSVLLNTLVHGGSKSCGCQVNYSVGKRVDEKTSIPPLDLEAVNNRKTGYWIITKEISAKRNEKADIIRTVEMKCKCGYIKECVLDNAGNSKQCTTCANEERMSKLSEEERGLNRSINNRYRGIIKRCYNPNDKAYVTYGAKGVDMCEEWLNSINTFRAWCKNNGLNEDNFKNLEIDREDSTKGYYPENCRFITKYENILRSLNLSMDDLHFIRGEEFNWELHRGNYKCTDKTLKNILEYKSFNIERLLI